MIIQGIKRVSKSLGGVVVKNRLFILVLMAMTLGFVVISGCSNERKQEELFDSFAEMLSNQDYGKLYALLSKESTEYITEEDFVTRYKTIYSGIQANDINIEKGEIDNEEHAIPFSLKMDTVAGKVNIRDYQLKLVKEEKEWKIKWDDRLIFPNMELGDKVRVDVAKATRGSILDRNGNPLAKDEVIKRLE